MIMKQFMTLYKSFAPTVYPCVCVGGHCWIFACVSMAHIHYRVSMSLCITDTTPLYIHVLL